MNSDDMVTKDFYTRNASSQVLSTYRNHESLAKYLNDMFAVTVQKTIHDRVLIDLHIFITLIS